MKRIVSGALCTLALAGLGSPAVALPIYFDFTGNLASTPDGAASGQAISGGFFLETDRLIEAPPPPAQRWWYESQPAGVTGPVAHLDLGIAGISFPDYAGQSDTVVSFNDKCTPGCAPFGSDNFSIFVSSADQLAGPGGFDGTVHRSWMYFSSLAVNRPAGGPIEFFDYFALADISLTSIVTLPLYELFGVYTAETLECAANSCRVLDQQQYGFSIDAVTRGAGVRSVPEPGTLGLLLAGLLAAFVMRRRLPDPQAA